jgi:hypothetical protein
LTLKLSLEPGDSFLAVGEVGVVKRGSPIHISSATNALARKVRSTAMLVGKERLGGIIGSCRLLSCRVIH